MANLVSPGVAVSVIDETFYDTAGAGTVPLIVIATHRNKQHPSGTGVAAGTLPENAGKLFLLSSQREAVQTFGYPKFYSDEIGTPLHGLELNEYGLHAIHQYLSVANRVYAINANIDLGQLTPNRYEPRSVAKSGTFWLDTYSTSFGVFTSNGGANPAAAWKSNKTRVIDTVSEIEKIILGTAQVDDTAIDVVLVDPSTLVINGTSIQVSGTLDQIINTINTTNITNIKAESYRLAEKSSLIIKNMNGGDLSLVGTNSVVFDSLGLKNDPYLVPKAELGELGDFGIITMGKDNVIYQKLIPQNFSGYPDSNATASYFIVGSAAWKMASPTVAIGTGFTPDTIHDNDSIIINGEAPIVLGTLTTIDDVVMAINLANVKNIVASKYSNNQLKLVNTAGESITVQNGVGAPLNSLGLSSVKGNELYYSSHTQYPSGSVTGDVWIKTTEYNNGAKWEIKVLSSATNKWTKISAPLIGNITPNAGESQEAADDRKASDTYGNALGTGSLYVRYNLYGTSGNAIASHEIRRYTGKKWETLVYEAKNTEPTSAPEDGAYWYSEDFKVDIMINKNGSEWVGYRKHNYTSLTDVEGPFVQATAPTEQRDGTPLVENDLWIDTSDLENYPCIYRYNEPTNKWIKVDNTDQTTPMGIVFDDARANSGPRLLPDDTYSAYSEDNKDLVLSNYVDPDCTDPRLYPDGTLLFNLRFSTLNVKQWKPMYFAYDYDGNDYTVVDSYNVGDAVFPAVEHAGRWVTVSGLKTDGSPYMWRKSQRAMIVRALQETIMSNEDARAESVYFNLIACPGYIETLDELIQLNIDKKETAFIIADSPPRLKPDAQSIQTWANPINDGQTLPNSEDSLGKTDAYSSVYYPWGMGTNYDGSNIFVPPSTLMLRVFAKSDASSYPWMAPVGFTRGLVDNATTVGYLTDENEFKTVILNQGQRDVLYVNRINPIAYIPNRGLVAYGQKTLYGNNSALDRINVARLVNYVRYNIELLAKNYLFEPNVKFTRDSVKITMDKFLSGLISTYGLYDFVTICDESNNTSFRINRNELWIDLAIQPVQSIEFIYIPIRLVNENT